METLHVIDQVFWLMIIRQITKKLPTCINSNGALLRQNIILIGTIFNVSRPAHNLTLYCRDSVQFPELQSRIHYGTGSFIRFTCIRTSSNFVQLCYFIFSCGASTSFCVMTSPYGDSLSHSLGTSQLMGLIWPSDQPDV